MKQEDKKLSETGVTKQIMLLNSVGSCRMFRINTGMAWAGQKMQGGMGFVALDNARPIVLGLATSDNKSVEGVSDILMMESVVITPEMVGKRVAIVGFIESKKGTKYGATPGQKRWIDFIRKMGGIAGVAKTPEEALKIRTDYLEALKK